MKLFRLFALLVFALLSRPDSRAAEPLKATAVIRGDQDGGEISRRLYGQFAEHLGRCIYDGLWVGEESAIPNTRGVRNDVIAALKAIKVPVLRWPGGCFADDYHWRDGIGPRAQRPKRINLHWGEVVESSAFGTHEFLDLCELIGAEPYIAGNVGSGTPHELRDWIEYMTYAGDSELANLRRGNGRDKPWSIPYVGVGNENWGCGGNMPAEHYADLFRQFGTFCRDLSGNRLQRVACGPSGSDPAWTRTLMDRAARQMQAYSVHFYTVAPSWQNRAPATGFGEGEWFSMLAECLKMEDILRENEEIMDRVDPDKRIALYLDEWGAWYRVEPGTPEHGLYQQNSLRDAVLAGLTFHIFHEHNDRLKMANIAQVVNVLQAMILTDRERLLLTPTYHVFEMFTVHHDANRLPVEIGEAPRYEHGGRSMPATSISASRGKDGLMHVSMVNAHATQSVKLTCELKAVQANRATGRILTAAALDAHNTFDRPEEVTPRPFDGARVTDGKLSVDLPPRSIVVVALD